MENLNELFAEHPELSEEVQEAINFDDDLTIACKCHCGSRPAVER